MEGLGSIASDDEGLFSLWHESRRNNYIDDTADKVMLVSNHIHKGGGIVVEKSWEGKEPSKTTVSVNGYVEDTRGNQVKGSISRNEEGRNKISIEASYDDKKQPEAPK